MEARLYSSNFHVDYGPESLFERIGVIFQEEKKLRIQGKHTKNRITNTYISTKILRDIEIFDPCQWRIVETEVRNDTGKLVNTTWEKEIEDEKIRIIIGFRDTVKSIEIDKEFKLFQKPIVKDGYVYNHVDRMNLKMLGRFEEAK